MDGVKYPNTYRGWTIRVQPEASGYRPHIMEPFKAEWAGLRWASSLDAAFAQARERIDRICEREVEDCNREWMRAST